MATPHVAGLASLLKGFNTNLANDDIEQIIRLSADDANAANGFPGFDNQMGTGRINAQRALQFLQAPNTVQHLSVTGGTVVNTTGNMTRIFLGVPGFADAAYIVRRGEVRTNVTFPAMCNIIGVWGRGVGTTGFREEEARNFGEGICEVVPGTLTSTTATLRTWIYEVWGVNGQYYGFHPRAANNVVFQYTVLGVPRPTVVSGDDAICGTTSNNYIIPNLPVGATVQWQATPSGIVTINSPNSPQTTLTQNSSGVITLTAAISNLCGGQQITLTKSNITVGTPSWYTLYASYSTEGYSNWLQDFNCLKSYTFPGMYSGNIDLYDQVATSYNWTFVSKYPSTATVGIGPNSDPQHVTVTVKPQNARVTYRLTTTNACGSYSHDYTFVADGPCLVEALAPREESSLSTSPNPTSGALSLKLSSKEDVSIREIIIMNKLDRPMKRMVVNGKTLTHTINISELPPNVYIIRVFDGKRWHSNKIVKQ